MTSKSSKKPKESTVRVPQTKDEVVAAIAEIGRCDRDLARIQTAMNEDLATVREHWEEDAVKFHETRKALAVVVEAWCEANRAELTQDGKSKTVSLASGEVSWRQRPPSVSVRGAEAVLAALKEKALDRFIRTKEEINKDAILADPDAILGIVKGVKIERGEDFTIKPFETELERGT